MEIEYLLRLVCRNEDDAKIRADASFAQSASHIACPTQRRPQFQPKSRATLVSAERQNAMLEDVVQRLSVESGVSAVIWEVAIREME